MTSRWPLLNLEFLGQRWRLMYSWSSKPYVSNILRMDRPMTFIEATVTLKIIRFVGLLTAFFIISSHIIVWLSKFKVMMDTSVFFFIEYSKVLFYSVQCCISNRLSLGSIHVSQTFLFFFFLSWTITIWPLLYMEFSFRNGYNYQCSEWTILTIHMHVLIFLIWWRKFLQSSFALHIATFRSLYRYCCNKGTLHYMNCMDRFYFVMLMMLDYYLYM